ncbi:MAG: peroxidase [Betaproteobacteria bacterium]|nr:peroxidase [Betaproteobacteria bacterium]
MPFLKSHTENAGPGEVFQAYPEVYRHWAAMGQALINGPSPLTPGEREMIQAFVAGLLGCQFAYVAHTAAAEARGIAPGTVQALVADVASAPVSDKLKPLLALVRKLVVAPTTVAQSDVDAVFAAGWDEAAHHSAVACTARMTFMSKIIHGHGFTPMSSERAKASAEHRAQVGYVALYPRLTKP